MKVLLIRHAVAEEREVFARSGKPDAERPLTREGRRKMRRAARGIRALVPKLDALAASPLARAAETGDVVAAAYGGGLRVVTCAPLAPGKPLPALIQWLRHQPAGATVALVGHEPDLGTFGSWLLTGLQESFLPLKKGGACLVEFEEEIKPGRALLRWVMQPGQLRQLGKRS
jgi:phosphohistidine phosphatase